MAVPQVVSEEGELLRNVFEDVLTFKEGQLLRVRGVRVELMFVTHVSCGDHEVRGASCHVRQLHQHLRLGCRRAQGVGVGTRVTDLVLVVDAFDRVGNEHAERIDLEQVSHQRLDVVTLVVHERQCPSHGLRFFTLGVREVTETIEPLVARDHGRVGEDQLTQVHQIQPLKLWEY